MKHKSVLALCFAIIFAIASGVGAQESSTSALSPDKLRGWLTYLASDELEGRATFSEGLGLAAAYISGELKESGVKPGGDGDTYFQRVIVLGIKSTNRSTLTVEVNGQTRTFRDNEGITFPGNVGRKRTLTLDKVEFVGYGLNLGAAHNDYEGVDVKEKAVVWLGPYGPKFADQERARRLIGSRASIATDEMGGAASIAPRFQTEGERGASPNAPDFTTTQRLDRVVTPNITATDEFLEFLFSASDVTYSDLKKKGEAGEDLPRFSLNGVKLTFKLDADYEVVNTRYTRNVIGIVEGTDTGLKDTYVAFGAHYDHTGYIQRPVNNRSADRIFNGADDDGSGTATMIGLARAFAQGPKTRRSLLFVWHSGEEHGLWGSEYFADYPTVPLDRIVAQINMDMVGRNRDNKDSEANTVLAVGADRISSDLHNVLIGANGSLPKSLTIDFAMNDPSDPERIYYRSDHYSYASKGIPVIFLFTGLHPDYHRLTDTVEKIDFEKMSRIGHLVYEIGRRVGNLDHAPVRDFRGSRMGKGSNGKIR